MSDALLSAFNVDLNASTANAVSSPPFIDTEIYTLSDKPQSNDLGLLTTTFIKTIPSAIIFYYAGSENASFLDTPIKDITFQSKDELLNPQIKLNLANENGIYAFLSLNPYSTETLYPSWSSIGLSNVTTSDAIGTCTWTTTIDPDRGWSGKVTFRVEASSKPRYLKVALCIWSSQIHLV